KLGQTMTGAPLIIRDKVLVGISGGEYGVRGYVSAFNLDTGNLVWRAYSVGPDSDILVDPQKTIDGATQRSVGANSSLKTWENEEWRLGGGTTWGWYTYDPQLNLFYYGSGNPGTCNPTQRPGDNKWSMTIFARNPDTGLAAWAYQMTPHDGWDYDGINESVLTEAQIGGNSVPTLTPFDPNAFDSVTGQTKWTINEPFQVYSGPLTTDGGLIFYGTLDGWFKVADQATGKVLYQFHTPSGIISNPITYTHNGKQYVALLSGVGGWAAIGLAEGLTQGTEGLGAVGLTHSLGDYTNLGGTLMVFSLE